MRILHTSDWQLGQYFLGHSRQAEHQKLIAWLVEQTRLHAVDLVLIAGDIFDTGAPPSYARELYYTLILALRDAGVGLTLLAGNHDSVAVLEKSRNLLTALNAIVIPSVQDDPNEQVRVLTTRDGKPGAIVCAIPFIRPRDVLQSIAGQSARDKQEGVTARCDSRALSGAVRAGQTKARGAWHAFTDYRDRTFDDGGRERE